MKYTKIPLKDTEEIKAFLSSHTLTEISEEWNIAYPYASQLCKKYGVKHKTSPNQLPYVDPEKVREYGKNHNLVECAAHFGLSTGTIARYKRYYGIEIIKHHAKGINCNNINTKKIKRTGEAQDMIKTLCKTYTDASIARVFGYSKERIRQLRNEAGIK